MSFGSTIILTATKHQPLYLFWPNRAISLLNNFQTQISNKIYKKASFQKKKTRKTLSKFYFFTKTRLYPNFFKNNSQKLAISSSKDPQ